MCRKCEGMRMREVGEGEFKVIISVGLGEEGGAKDSDVSGLSGKKWQMG